MKYDAIRWDQHFENTEIFHSLSNSMLVFHFMNYSLHFNVVAMESYGTEWASV